MEILSKLFGSEAKVKIIRLFLFNPEMNFDITNVSERIKESLSKTKKEISLLEKMTLVKRKVLTKFSLNKSKRKIKKTSILFSLNTNFTYLSPLQNFLINSKPLAPKEIERKICSLGSIKLIIISGVFIQDVESRVDILIVGDNVKKTSLENMIKTLEAEIGKELKYAHFTTADFQYRLRMFDKLIRDILDYPHEKILNKLGNI